MDVKFTRETYRNVIIQGTNLSPAHLNTQMNPERKGAPMTTINSRPLR